MCLEHAVNMRDCIPMHVPFTGSITDLKELSADRRQWFITAVGMIGWLSHTTRPDIRYAYSRVAQHVAKPCQGAFDKLVQIVRCLATTAKLSLRQELNVHVPLRCYCDADFAGNAEVGNAGRSQHGYIILRECSHGVLFEGVVHKVWFSIAVSKFRRWYTSCDSTCSNPG